MSLRQPRWLTRNRLRKIGLAVLITGLGSAIAAATVGFGGSDRVDTTASGRPPAVATVTQGTLIQTERVDGTLNYGARTLVTGRLSGMVTGLPALGARIERGQPLYHVDATPVVLLYGGQPLHRRLSPGSQGGDARLLEENLAALGYSGFSVDDQYTLATADAVRRWQADLGLPQTGGLEPSRVVTAAGPVRVGALRAHLGDSGTGPIMEYTGLVRQVIVRLDVTKQDLAKAGDAATVELPNRATVDGVLASVGTVATATTVNNQTAVTIDVTITVADQEKLGRYDEAPVKVSLVRERRENVLTVPVAALLALADGGYGVQVVAGSDTRILAVRTGMFANGRVEISGDGLRSGLTVGMPS